MAAKQYLLTVDQNSKKLRFLAPVLWFNIWINVEFRGSAELSFNFKCLKAMSWHNPVIMDRSNNE